MEAVGFDSNGRVIQAEFVFNTTNSTTGDVYENKITVPYLLLLPMPFLQVCWASHCSRGGVCISGAAVCAGVCERVRVCVTCLCVCAPAPSRPPPPQVYEASISFNMQVTSSTSSSSSSTDSGGWSGSFSANGWGGSVTANARFASSSRSDSSGSSQQSFSMSVNVTAVQDDVPRGMQRILDLLETAFIVGPDHGNSSSPVKY